MKSSTESLSPTRVKLTIEVPFEEFQPQLDEAYKSIGQQINVPGFRKGKVPPPIIDQRIGRSTVLDEAMNNALPDWYSQAVQESEIQPLSQPDIDLAKFDDGEAIEITAELDVRPDIELPDLTNLAATVADADVTDEDVDEQITGLQEKFATHVDVDRAAADGDYVSIDLSAAQDGELIEAAQAEDMPYTIGKATMVEGLDEALIGLSKGETRTFATQLAGGELAGQDVDVTVMVNEVKQVELPELDDEFAQTASDGADTIDELRAEIVEKLTRGKRLEQAAEARDNVLDNLVAQVDVPLPDDLVSSETESRREQMQQELMYSGMTFEQYLESEEQTQEEFDADLDKRVRDSIVAQFLLDAVVKRDEIELENDELTQHIMQRAQQSGQDPQAFVQHLMEHNHVPEMASEVLRGKALASLVESAQVTDESGNPVRLEGLQSDGSFPEENPEDESDAQASEQSSEAPSSEEASSEEASTEEASSEEASSADVSTAEASPAVVNPEAGDPEAGGAGENTAARVADDGNAGEQDATA